MTDRDFDLRILKAGSHYLADVRSPDGEEANRPFELPISPERLDELFRGLGHPRSKATRGGGSPEVRQARDFGRQLFEAVFAGEIRDVFQRSLGRVEARGGDLRIRLRLAPNVPELLDLPWELLFDRGRNRFLALEPATTLVRHLPVQQRVEPMRVAPPLHILVAISNPGQAGYPVGQPRPGPPPPGKSRARVSDPAGWRHAGIATAGAEAGRLPCAPLHRAWRVRLGRGNRPLGVAGPRRWATPVRRVAAHWSIA